MKCGRTVTALAVALLSCSAAAAAQTSGAPLPTPSPTPAAASDPCSSILSIVNRPTIGTGVCTVRAGHVVVETGYVNTVTTGPGGGNTSVWGASLVRFGTSDSHLDLEIAPPNVSYSSAGGSRVTGSSDMALIAKYEGGYNANALWGVNAQVTLPSGTPAFTAGGPQYTGNFNWGYTISPEFGASGTLGFNAFSGFTASGTQQGYFAFVPTLELTAAIPGSGQLFGEYAYFSQAGVGLGSKNEFDFGFQHQLGTHVLFDVEYGFTPTVLSGQQQHYLGAGLSFMN